MSIVICPECRGHGQDKDEYLYSSLSPNLWTPCNLCDGVGSFSEEEFIVLKLSGNLDD